MLASPDLPQPKSFDATLEVNLAAVERAMHDVATAAFGGDRLVDRAILHHLGSGGKRARARLALASADALALEPGDAVAIAACCELLHNASLIHDDLQDRDERRRGQPAVWKAFGDDVALLAGDLMLSSAYHALAGVGPGAHLAALLRIVHARTATLIRGQAADLHGGSAGLPDYEQVASTKSGPLLGLPLELPLVAAGLVQFMDVAREAAEAFAIGYQIADDLQDIARDDPARTARGTNVVWVLRDAAAGPEAERIAARHAAAALARADARAGSLPNGSGELLCSYARRLREDLQPWCQR